MDGARLRTNSPPVVYETVEGETIVVNLETGSYYDLDAVGGYIFGSFEHGATVTEVAERLAVACAVGLDAARAIVDDFAARLAHEQLLVTATTGANGNGAAPPAEIAAPTQLAEPVLNKYTDMQELLLLDPVHEVTEAGWPTKA
jgi:hypothetical protein